jgi:transcriptional regulator with GAF, ATPase, and Fis domain
LCFEIILIIRSATCASAPISAPNQTFFFGELTLALAFLTLEREPYEEGCSRNLFILNGLNLGAETRHRHMFSPPKHRAFGHLALQLLTRRGFLILAGISVCLYAISVLLYVQTLPDLGLRTVFSPILKTKPRYSVPGSEGLQPREGDTVLMVGDIPIRTWADLLTVPLDLQGKLSPLPPWAKWVQREDNDQLLVHVDFERAGENGTVRFGSWCVLGNLPLEEMVPSVLWFFLKAMLFTVGALVLWKRPTDRAAAQFFLLCIVTLGAYMGGYHWPFITTQPVLLLVFMVCAVLLPVISLHFYLMFPREKAFMQKHPRIFLMAVYGPPLAFLGTLVVLYFRLRSLSRGHSAPEEITQVLDALRLVISSYLLVASVWYLGSVASLIHSFLTVADAMEKKQVQWILVGAVLALVPFSYSLYLALYDPDAFGRGEATWPMFAASVCLTAAFAISITRYRLMELDKIVSAGMGYFLISFLAGLAYLAVLLVGALLFKASPKLSDVLTVSTTALVLMLVLDLARSRLKKVLDRRFYRDKTQLDRTLQRLGQAIEQLVDPPALARRLLHASAELLGVARGAVYLRQGEPPLFQLAGSLGEPPPLTDLSLGCPLIEGLQGGRVVATRPRNGFFPTPAQRQLELLGGEIAQPLIHEGRLLALLVLGRKDFPYRPEDLDLLAAFAQITVLALESAEGHRTIELLNRDLQTKVEKISEQQRRILVLQSQLQRQRLEDGAKPPAADNDNGVGEPTPGGIVGSSPAIRQLLHLVQKVSATDAVVLIRGESGTGKELLARALHETSSRAGKAFVKVHCAALSTGLLESELFGHVKGAYTGAHRDKVGRFELAHGGTLFLDEIGDISLEVQTKLLRVLQEKRFERVGSSEPVTVDVRIITATHQDLENLIRLGRFREDLFYRLNVFPILVPSLRERLEDIAELALHFMRQSALRCHKDVVQIDDDVLGLLKQFSWPGNIRQLENVIERAVVVAEGTAITMAELPLDLVHTLENGALAPVSLRNGRVVPVPRGERDRQEREILVRALASAGGNKAEAARALGVARSTLVSRLKKLGLS